MGCISSKKDLHDINPNVYRVVNVDDERNPLWSGHLEISRTELTLYRKHKEPTQWPLKCLRRYGFDDDLFTFEAGRRCTTGEGIYAFRCTRAESLFQTLQNYIQLPLEENPIDMFPVPTATNGPAVIPRNRGSAPSSMSTSGTCLLGGGGGGGGYVTNRPISQNLSPSGTIQSNSNRSHSSDTLNGEGNYLEPTPCRPTAMSRFPSGLRLGSVSSGGPLSPEPHSPGSPNSITNILEVTTLNPLPVANPGISNLYQEFPLREHNNNIHLNNNHQKKLSLDIPPQEPAPTINLSALKTESAVMNNNEMPIATDLENKLSYSPNLKTSDSFDSAHMYMNVAPGEICTKPLSSSTSTGNGGVNNDIPQIAQTPTTSVTTMFGITRINSSFSIDPNRLYENLESAEIRPLLKRNQRFSKPDIFGKVDLPPADKSEPCTPNIHYIVLDLDQTTPNIAPISSQQNHHNINLSLPTINGPTTPTVNAPNITSNNSAIMTTSSMSSITLLPPESPKKGVMDYATIDFNKTVALSNSTTPSSELDSEGSRKTRHSSVAAPFFSLGRIGSNATNE